MLGITVLRALFTEESMISWSVLAWFVSSPIPVSPVPEPVMGTVWVMSAPVPEMGNESAIIMIATA